MGAVSENGRTGNGMCQHEGTWTDGKCDDCGYECLHEDANENNGTIKQISQLSNGGTLSIYGANCTIDLNNQTIGYIAAGGSNLTITGDGTDTLLNTESGSAKLYGGVYNEITLPASTALRSLLPDGYGFKKTSDDSWITGEELEITGSLALNKTGPVRIEQAPITNLTVDAPDITYCDDLTATATVKTVDGAEAVTYKWYIDGTELTDRNMELAECGRL